MEGLVGRGGKDRDWSATMLSGAEDAADRVQGPWASRGGSVEAPRRPRRQDDGGPKGGEEDIEEREVQNSEIRTDATGSSRGLSDTWLPVLRYDTIVLCGSTIELLM